MAVVEKPSTTSDEQRVRERVDQLVADHDPKDVKGFLGAQFDLGLAWVHFPEGRGGLGVNPKLQSLVSEATTTAGAPIPYWRNPIGYGMGAPTVVTHGSEAQQERYLRPLFTGEEIWCQLFSEPGSGSDLAGLATRAVRDGRGRAGGWVVTGQ
nr:acyl-CoA dehydrogenase family protein [Acidimicrobiia bacterium]